jgi:hypothetical protein
MATHKSRSKGKGKGDGGKGGGGDGDGEPQGPGKHHGGDPVRIHEDYVRRHLGGGAPATPETYERAVKQFNRLPGALRTPTKASPQRDVQKRDGDGQEPGEDDPEKSPK